MSQKITLMATRHSAFYGPLHSAISAAFLKKYEIEAEYLVGSPAAATKALLDGSVHVAQSAVSASWDEREKGIFLPLRHFCTINCRDGFFLVRRSDKQSFKWADLAGQTVLVDHGRQPYVGFCHAAFCQNLDLEKVDITDVGGNDDILQAFRDGKGEYAHLQGPAAQQLELEGHGKVVASCGDASGPFAFSSLRASDSFLSSELAIRFTNAFAEARIWTATQPATEVAQTIQKAFPDVRGEELLAAVNAYQKVGCWLGPLEIDDESYNAAHDAFTRAGRNTIDHPKSEVVVAPPK